MVLQAHAQQQLCPAFPELSSPLPDPDVPKGPLGGKEQGHGPQALSTDPMKPQEAGKSSTAENPPLGPAVQT